MKNKSLNSVIIPTVGLLIAGCNSNTNNNLVEDTHISETKMFENLYDHSLNGTVILKHSIIPTEALVRTWTDENFQKRVFLDTDSTLKRYYYTDSNIEFIAHHFIEGNIKNYCLPYSENENNLTKAELKTIIENDIKISKADYFLPASIIALAITNEEFREELLKNPDKVLKDNGYETGDFKCQIIEDGKYTRNIIVPTSPLTLQN